jgi:hypothetical protein
MKYKTIIYALLIMLMLLIQVNSSSGNKNIMFEWENNDTISPRIDREMLRMFEEFKKRGTFSESFYFSLIQAWSNRETSRWNQLLEEFRGAREAGEDPFAYNEFIELVEQDVTDFLKETTGKATKNDIQNAMPEATVVQSNVSSHPLTYYDFMAGQTALAIKYHIQIAASKVPLETEYLKKKYGGDLEIVHFNEDGWEKYFIGNFSSFTEARAQLKNTSVAGAFIIAWINQNKVLPFKARQAERLIALNEFPSFQHIRDDHFRIQIAASKKPLTEEQIKKIYSEPGIVAMILEDDWFKYSIPGASSLAESWIVARQTNVNGAFVVRYRNGRKIPLK